MPLSTAAAGLTPSRALLVSWGKLHNVRRVLGAASMMVFALALTVIA